MVADLVSHRRSLFCAAHGAVLFLAVLLILIWFTALPHLSLSNHFKAGSKLGLWRLSWVWWLRWFRLFRQFFCCRNGVSVLVMLRLADCCVCRYVWLLLIWVWLQLQLCWLGEKSLAVDEFRYDSSMAVKMVYPYPCVFCCFVVFT